MENLAWKRQEPTEVTKVGYRTVVEKTFELPDGTVQRFGTLEAEDSAGAAVIALTPKNMVVVVNLFRPGPERVMQEIPGGIVDAEDDPAEIVVKELQEETGYAIGSIAYLGFCNYDAYTNRKRYYYLARNCEPSGRAQQLESEEQLTVEEISIEQLITNATTGRMTDPGAVLLAFETLQQLR